MSKNRFVESEKILEEINEVIDEPVITHARIAGCDKLNVRSKPDIESDVVTIIDKETKFVIDDIDAVGDWYPVTLENGTSGFCLKNFVIKVS